MKLEVWGAEEILEGKGNIDLFHGYIYEDETVFY